jgi:acyl carrier protein
VTEQEVFTELRPLVREVTGAKLEAVGMDSVLMQDLGAESLDLLDLSFLIEERFGITIEPDEFERRARARIPGGVYERDGYLSPEALAELRQALPELKAGVISEGLRRADLPSLLTVSVFVHLIGSKLAEKAEASRHA